MPLISVVIPALNEAELIGRCLESLARSNYSANNFEIIVADNGSTDGTVEIVSRYMPSLPIALLQQPGITVSKLRNLGAAKARGEILAFLDADCVVPSDWLQKAEQYVSTKDSGIVGGSITIPRDSRWVARTWYGLGYAPRNGNVSYVPAGNLLVRRSDFQALGGFADELRTAEDFDLCVRARQAGLSVCAVAEMAVLHLRTPQTLRQFYSRERWHGVHVLRALRKNLGNWSDFRAYAFGLYMLLCTLGILTGLGHWNILLTAVAAMVGGAGAATLLKLRAVRRCKVNWLSFSQLIILHVVFGLARARALISVSATYPRSEIRVKETNTHGTRD